MMNTAALAAAERPLVASPSLTSAKAVWFGRVLSGLVLLFLAFDAGIKLAMMPVAVQASAQLGYSASAIFAVGVIAAACLVLYVIPRTAILGAVLWTGYFGGAIATHLRAGSPLLTHTLSPIVFAALLWIGLWLRDTRLRRIVRVTFDAADPPAPIPGAPRHSSRPPA